MIDRNLMDLTTKPGKANGGYMTFFPDYKAPFIFSNFNGTSGDVDVLTHEAGHAFNGYLQRDVELSGLADFTSEVAEIHSMAMEFFTHPWMKRFFKEDTTKYYYDHVVSAIQFLPYGASVDELQEWVYEHPDATPAERHAQYRLIEKKYMPHLDYDGVAYLEQARAGKAAAPVPVSVLLSGLYAGADVFPQYFTWDMQDHEAAWASYLNVCKRAGACRSKSWRLKPG